MPARERSSYKGGVGAFSHDLMYEQIRSDKLLCRMDIKISRPHRLPYSPQPSNQARPSEAPPQYVGLKRL